MFECFECDKRVTGGGLFARRYGDSKVWLCGVCDSVTPEYRAGNVTRVASFE
jgi:hypothetical protein